MSTSHTVSAPDHPFAYFHWACHADARLEKLFAGIDARADEEVSRG